MVENPRKYEKYFISCHLAQKIVKLHLLFLRKLQEGKSDKESRKIKRKQNMWQTLAKIMTS